MTYFKFNIYYLIHLVFFFTISSTCFGQGPLSSGKVYKIKVDKSGVYKLDATVFNELGIDYTTINPQNISVFGFGYGMMPQPNAIDRPSTLLETPIQFVGQNSSSFSENDYFLFYADGPDKVIFDQENEFVDYELNLYDTDNYYFIKVGSELGARINIEDASVSNPSNFSKLIEVVHHEEELVKGLSEPSGRFWFGESFISTTDRTIEVPILSSTSSTKLKLKPGVMAKSRAESTFSFTISGSQRGEVNVPAAPDFNSYRYGNQGHMVNTMFDQFTVSSLGAAINVDISYSKPISDSEGYLDYLTFNVERALQKTSGGIVLHGFLGSTEDGASIENPNNLSVWNISHTDQIKELTTTSGRVYLPTDEDNFSVIAFDKNDVLLPIAEGEISNQDLRNLNTPHLIIITAPQYLSESQKFADHRKSHSNIDVTVVTIDEVYNEFSSGRQDVTAIRDFARHLYLSNPEKLKYLLLIGQGSYDYKDIKTEGGSQVAIYESRDVLMRTRTFSSDDYFGFFDEDEGFWGENIDGQVDNDDLEIGIGRLPVKNSEHAETMINKIIYYDTATQNLNQWKKSVLFVADDGDNNTHQRDANDLAVYVEENNPDFNSERLYIDNQPKETSPTGAVSPETNELLVDWIENKEVLIVNYSGHGSVSKWADEDIFNIPTIADLSNNAVLPLFFTATCEFGRYDNPAITSGAERLVFLENAGAIAMMTTTRPVYASSNFKINKAFYENVFQKESDGTFQSLGEVFRLTKNQSLSGVNNRNFALLGDPSLELSLPSREVSITSLNGESLTGEDTISALDRVSISGEVTLNGQKDESFKGEVYLTMYEKPVTSSTRGNDGEETVFQYQERKFQLYRGVTNIENGTFNTNFVVPKDIRYSFGNAKFSFYAINDETNDALGSNVDIILGGTSKDPVIDDTPPSIQLMMNGVENTTNVYPDCFVQGLLNDESGINLSGLGVGHDLLLQLDGGDTSWVVNDYVQPLNDGNNTYSFVFPLNDLEVGEHTLTLEAWDVLNNRSEATITFYVSPVEAIEVESFIAYPNPVYDDFTLSFMHNIEGQNINVITNIIDMTGKVVISSENEFESVDNSIQLYYNGLKSQYGLYPGVYVVQSIINCKDLNLNTVKTTRIILN
ncbi:type IX secretion system sortase PorU [Flammeovirga agarivorans]|uniref:Type IX secretion system sortase PorU n=1 Tax=Flammeovirga agarivorans TaxID=2726742 RepID=A0A7X8SGA7_9BACT|nr:type IX secretion system sortase PorU [Flammeovirga agarivorans]NLR89683.1 type IX secretion system sortase PorU [Flammeovirga agarivorans]